MRSRSCLGLDLARTFVQAFRLHTSVVTVIIQLMKLTISHLQTAQYTNLAPFYIPPLVNNKKINHSKQHRRLAVAQPHRNCAPAAPPIMLRIGTYSLNPIPNPNPIP